MRRIALLLAIVFAGCWRPEATPNANSASANRPGKDPATARALIATGAVVIDVRTADEYAGGHLASAVNLPVQELSSRLGEIDALVAGDKTRPVVVYCAAGGRAAKAKLQLEAAGYAHVVNGGGFDDLRDAPATGGVR
jgi:phage shock protein E